MYLRVVGILKESIEAIIIIKPILNLYFDLTTKEFLVLVLIVEK